MAPSKTFNIAGVVSSYCVAFNPELRQKFYSYIESAEIDYPSIFSAEATRAAYTPSFKGNLPAGRRRLAVGKP